MMMMMMMMMTITTTTTTTMMVMIMMTVTMMTPENADRVVPETLVLFFGGKKKLGSNQVERSSELVCAQSSMWWFFSPSLLRVYPNEDYRHRWRLWLITFRLVPTGPTFLLAIFIPSIDEFPFYVASCVHEKKNNNQNPGILKEKKRFGMIRICFRFLPARICSIWESERSKTFWELFRRNPNKFEFNSSRTAK